MLGRSSTETSLNAAAAATASAAPARIAAPHESKTKSSAEPVGVQIQTPCNMSCKLRRPSVSAFCALCVSKVLLLLPPPFFSFATTTHEHRAPPLFLPRHHLLQPHPTRLLSLLAAAPAPDIPSPQPSVLPLRYCYPPATAACLCLLCFVRLKGAAAVAPSFLFLCNHDSRAPRPSPLSASPPFAAAPSHAPFIPSCCCSCS